LERDYKEIEKLEEDKTEEKDNSWGIIIK